QQRRLSKKFGKGAKPQSKNYHKARERLGKTYLKMQRQRKDWAIKSSLCIVIYNDIMVHEDLKVANMVKNHSLAQSISFDNSTAKLLDNHLTNWLYCFVWT
ncbi:MAG: transposase, partial [Microcystaceae cyanobacterium]